MCQPCATLGQESQCTYEDPPEPTLATEDTEGGVLVVVRSRPETRQTTPLTFADSLNASIVTLDSLAQLPDIGLAEDWALPSPTLDRLALERSSADDSIPL